jgi:uncharacterized protein YkwD
MRLRRTIFVALALTSLPIAARGATISFTVQNGRGVPQAVTAIAPCSDCQGGVGSPHTNGWGQATLNVSAGQTLFVQRGFSPSFLGCPAPEGSGQPYRVPDPVPAAATITLPNSNGDTFDPASSNNERWLVGKVNQARAAEGLAPYFISLTLNEAADRYANYLLQTDQFNHCAIGNASVRAIDAGWPIRCSGTACGAAENIARGYANPADTFEGWMNSPGHRANFLRANFATIGIAEVGEIWVADIGPSCPQSAEASERCRMTSDIGAPNLPVAGANQVDQSLGKALRKCRQKKSRKARKRCRHKVKKRTRR